MGLGLAWRSVMLLVATMMVVIPLALADASTDPVSHILALTDSTFSDKVKEKDTLWLVKFCVPWCKYCARADMVWEELGQDLYAEDGVEIGQVDCTSNKATCTKVGIRSYPTLKLFYNGEEYKTYKGKRELADLKSFALEAVAELSQESVEEA